MIRKSFTIAMVPFYPVLGAVEKNLENIVVLLEKILSEEKDIRMIVLPELALSGYALENLIAYTELEPDDDRLKALLKISAKVDIIIGSVLLKNYHFYNSAFFLKNERVQSIQKKIYLPTYGMFDEGRYFSNGETLEHFNTDFGKSAVLICEDAWHPVLAYSLYVQKVSHVFVISSSPGREFQENSSENFLSHSSWQNRLQVYAESFGQFYFYINRGGVEDGVFFNAESFAVSPTGEIIQAIRREDDYHIYSFNNEDMISARIKGGPYHEENFTLNKKLLDQAYRNRDSL